VYSSGDSPSSTCSGNLAEAKHFASAGQGLIILPRRISFLLELLLEAVSNNDLRLFHAVGMAPWNKPGPIASLSRTRRHYHVFKDDAVAKELIDNESPPTAIYKA
jgi:hypothetical protein